MSENNNEQKQSFSAFNQFDLKAIYLYKDESTPIEDRIDIRPFMKQFDIYEDVFSPTISANLFLMDSFNLPDRFPLTGGERIKIIFKTPSFKDEQEQIFVIYKVGERKAEQSRTEKEQLYILNLCTPDRWFDLNNNFSRAYKGKFEIIASNVIQSIESAKKIDTEESVGIFEFISPYWSPLKICAYAAERAQNINKSPFIFFETMDGYKFLSLEKLYTQKPYKKLYIEDRRTTENANSAEKSFNTVIDWEYLASNNKMKQIANKALGTTVFSIDLESMNIQKTKFDYTEFFNETKTHIEQYPMIDLASGMRDVTTSMMVERDLSHMAKMQRNSLINTMDNYKILAKIPGDNELRAGSILELDVPSKDGSTLYADEQTTSGRWFVPSVRHVITTSTYHTIIELCKDSFKEKLTSRLK